MESVARWSRFVGDTFAVWVLLFAFLGYAFPGAFRELSAYIVPLLGVVMFGMGLTLSAADFRAVLRRPREVAIGVVAQYLIMPLVATPWRGCWTCRRRSPSASSWWAPVRGARPPTS